MKPRPERFVIWSNEMAGWRREADGATEYVTLLANATRYDRGAAVDIVAEKKWLCQPTDVQPDVMLLAPECAA